VTADDPTQPSVEAPPGRNPGALALRWGWLLPLCAAFAPTAAWLWERWTRSVMDNAHGLFMPLVAAYLVREQLRLDPVAGPRASALGFAFVVPGLAMLVLDTGIRSELMAAAGLVVILPGLALLLLGARRTRLIALPLVIAAMMLPIPSSFVSGLHLVLRHVTAVVTEQLVPLVGPQISRDGTMLHLPHAWVSVADACSGFGTLYASVATALILAQLVHTPRRRASLLAACVPIALVTNWIRVTALVLIAHYWGPQMLQTWLHEWTGFASFVVALIVLFSIAGREVLPDPAARPVTTPVSTRFALPLAALCTAALVPVALNSYAGRRNDDCAHPEVLVPGGGAASGREPFDAFAFRQGSVRGAADLSYTIARSYDPKKIYHRPEYWLTGHREPIASAADEIDAADRSLPIRRLEFRAPHGRVDLAAYLLVYRGEPVASPIRAQLAAAPALVLRGQQPMTLYYARVVARHRDAQAAGEALDRWLASSWKQYQEICGTRSD
jgi:exosortase